MDLKKKIDDHLNGEAENTLPAALSILLCVTWPTDGQSNDLTFVMRLHCYIWHEKVMMFLKLSYFFFFFFGAVMIVLYLILIAFHLNRKTT